jgi:hypothetical protein
MATEGTRSSEENPLRSGMRDNSNRNHRRGRYTASELRTAPPMPSNWTPENYKRHVCRIKFDREPYAYAEVIKYHLYELYPSATTIAREKEGNWIIEFPIEEKAAEACAKQMITVLSSRAEIFPCAKLYWYRTNVLPGIIKEEELRALIMEQNLRVIIRKLERETWDDGKVYTGRWTVCSSDALTFKNKAWNREATYLLLFQTNFDSSARRGNPRIARMDEEQGRTVESERGPPQLRAQS